MTSLLLNVLIILFHNIFVSATDFYWIAAGNTCHKSFDVEYSCIHYDSCLRNKNDGRVEFCYFDKLKPILCCVKNDELQDNDEIDVLQKFSLLHDSPVKSAGIIPWDVSTDTWKSGWDYKFNSVSSGHDFELPIYDWTKSLFNGGLVVDENLPKIDNVYDVAATASGGLDITNRLRDSNGLKLPPDVFGARITDNAEGLNIQKPYYRPTIENSTSLRMCSSYFRSKRQTSLTPAVIGGTDAAEKQYPHLALLGYGDPDNISWACGGTLISEQYILTAAHCIYTLNQGTVKYVRLGEVDLNSTADDVNVRDFMIADVITHPLYNFISDYHDIGLIRLNESIASFNEYIKPACLATTRELENVDLSVAGWGRTEVNAASANILQTASLKLVANDVCQRFYRNASPLRDGIIEDVHICADGGTEREDACSGDSGGPLQFTNNNFIDEGVPSFVEIAGVVSFGRSCGIVPGVYTRVLPYVQWIEGKVWPTLSTQ